MGLKVVNLGLPKTGTTTLGRALRIAGYKAADHIIAPHRTDDPTIAGKFVAELLYRGRFESGDPGALLGEFTALAEISLLLEGRNLWPQMDYGLIQAIRLYHPDVKFLASSRDPFALSQSMLGWSNLGVSRLPAANVPGLPNGYGSTTKERTAWIESHYAFLRNIFQGSSQFLEFDIEDPAAPDQIAEFLGCPLPWWGHLNRNLEYKRA